MDNEKMIGRSVISGKAGKAAAAAIGILLAVTLPQLFHLVGDAIGAGSLPGEVYLPMHIPVMLTGALAGPMAGVLAGAFGPLASSAMTGMPAQAMLPFMMIELAVYGLTFGLMGEHFTAGGSAGTVGAKAFIATLISQAAGRLAKTAAILIAFYGLGMKDIPPQVMIETIRAGVPGMVIQLVLIPVIILFASGLTENRS